MPAAYPILLDIARLRIVIVGGGGVAKRKAIGLIDAGATNVTVVSPTLAEGFPPVTHVAATYSPGTSAGLLAGATLVFAATSDAAVNAAVVSDARAAGALANRADTDEAAPADFSTPAKFTQGPVTVTVSAGSAALTAALRDGLRNRFDPRWSAMADAMTTLRPLLRDRLGLTPARRAELFRRLATDEAFAVLDERGIDGLIAWLGVDREG